MHSQMSNDWLVTKMRTTHTKQCLRIVISKRNNRLKLNYSIFQCSHNLSVYSIRGVAILYTSYCGMCLKCAGNTRIQYDSDLVNLLLFIIRWNVSTFIRRTA